MKEYLMHKYGLTTERAEQIIQEYETFVRSHNSSMSIHDFIKVTSATKCAYEPPGIGLKSLNVLYPELKDMENAVLTLENGFLLSALTPMLTKEEEKELCLLLYKWKSNFRNHKKEVINGMASELSEK